MLEDARKKQKAVLSDIARWLYVKMFSLIVFGLQIPK
jgi:hypothetical protein